MRIPRYRCHSSNIGFVEYNGRRIYFKGAPYNSKKSRQQYMAFLNEIQGEGERPPEATPGLSPAIASIVERFLDHSETENRDPGGTFKPLHFHYRGACRALVQAHGDTDVRSFGVRALKDVRKTMLGYDWSRGYINSQVQLVRRVILWAVEEEMIPVSVYRNLIEIESLRKKKSSAKGKKKVRPVDQKHVYATLAHVSPVVAAMACLQRLTGMRPSEVCRMRGCDIDKSDTAAWVYEPYRHKTQDEGFERYIFLGPRAQMIVREFSRADPKEYLFRPADTLRWRWQLRCRQSRDRNGDKLAVRVKKARPRYNKDSYRRAIWYGIQQANKRLSKLNILITEEKDKHPLIPNWSPHRLRHSRGTEVRQSYGLEGAQVTLGHAHMETTEIYAERNRDLARRISLETG